MTALRSAFLAITLSGLAVVAGCASPQKNSARHANQNCFYASQVNNFASVDRNTVNFRVGVSDIYTAHLLGNCGDIAWSNAIAFESGPNSLVCNGLDATIIVPTMTGPRRCPLSSIRKLSVEEVKALPKGTKP